MTEQTRALIYRLGVLVLLGFIVWQRPDSFEELLPYIVGLIGNGLATGYTRLRQP